MSLDRYRLRAQLGAGPDGVGYRALAEDGETEVGGVLDLFARAARRNLVSRWERLVFRGSEWRRAARSPLRRSGVLKARSGGRPAPTWSWKWIWRDRHSPSR